MSDWKRMPSFPWEKSTIGKRPGARSTLRKMGAATRSIPITLTMSAGTPATAASVDG